jgi:hypothetical protein
LLNRLEVLAEVKEQLAALNVRLAVAATHYFGAEPQVASDSEKSLPSESFTDRLAAVTGELSVLVSDVEHSVARFERGWAT